MPDGKTHDTISLFTTPIVGILSFIIVNDIRNMLLITISYVFASFMFNGDLDIPSRPFNRWWLFKMIWIPYQVMFTHRSIFTHGLIIGTVIRVIYIGIIPFLYLLFNDKLNILLSIDIKLIISILVGLELGSAIHTVSDKTF